MATPLPPGSTIGIIGGGQLGRMLAMAAARFSYRTIILEPQADCPAAQVASQQIVAAYDDPAALARLAAESAVITYEFENVPIAAAVELTLVRPVYPPAKALEISQDRLLEKRFLNEIGIPTARFEAVDSDAGLWVALQKFGGSGVLKTRRLGYDGKGQRVLRGAQEAETRGAYAAMGDVPLILEELIAFESEVSVIAARAVDGSSLTYDVAENVHRDGILRTSTVPANISAETAATAAGYAAALMQRLDYVGVVGLELFVCADDRLIANEFAPRVHNSGHWTEAACAISQFENHIRAVAGLPLGATGRHSYGVMENLIGDDVLRLQELAAQPNVMVHLYGKAEARPGRKMGHFTRISPNVRKA
jgi:5-(carboxyamino)imidazole ribonucleotide synthase